MYRIYTEVDNSGKITLDTYMSDGRNMVNIDNPVFVDTFGNLGAGAAKYESAALAYNGKIYCSPWGAAQVLEIDPSTKSFKFIGTNYGTSSNKWQNIVLAQNGNLYCTPRAASQVLEINPNNLTTSLIGANLGTDNNKWMGAALTPNGKIYCAPGSSDKILEIDPVAKTATKIGDSYGQTSPLKWNDCILAPNGLIYFIPGYEQQVLVFDPVSGVAKKIGELYGTAQNKWHTAVLANNSKIYAVGNSGEVLIIDTKTDTTSLANKNGITVLLHTAIVLSPNGMIYCAPCNGNKILEINTENDTLKYLDNSFAFSGQYASKWMGGCLAPNGVIFYPPAEDYSILTVDTFPKSTDFQAYLKLP